MSLQSRRLGLTLAVLFSVVAAGAAKGQGAKDDKFAPAKLLGTWKYESGSKNGEKLGPDRLNQPVVITKDTFTLKGEQAFVMQYELDTKKSPVAVRFTIKEGPVGVGATAEGIIVLKGDDLNVCYAPMGGPAPTKFEAKEGSNHYLFVLKRSK
jgi:uncharacterized protein (TIGR03067 family)